jgi:ABC-type lipoprotein release transport system permease subunit
VEVGQKIVLSVQDLHQDLTGRAYRVSGLFDTASSELDENTLFLSLAEAQRLFGLADSVSEFVLIARERDDIDELAEALKAALGERFEVHTWEQLRPLLVVIVESFDMMAWYLYAAVFVAMAFGIANVLLMAVFERTREIGMMMALGMKRGRVVTLVVAESMIVTAVGLLLGFFLAGVGVFLLQDGIEFGAYAESLGRLGSTSRIVPHLRPADLGIPLVVAGVASLVASLWPALRAARLRPGAALRRI